MGLISCGFRRPKDPEIITLAHCSSNEYLKRHLLTIREKGGNINARCTFTGGTALMATAFRGNEESVKLLIEHGADVNIKNRYKTDALHFASSKGKGNIVDMLIKAGADVNSLDSINLTAMATACREGHVNCVDLLIKAGADVNIPHVEQFTALTWASRFGRVECVNSLIAAGADVNLEARNTPLMMAAENGHSQCVNKLIIAGADVNRCSDFGKNTALIKAALNGHTQCVKMLIDAGADVNITETDPRFKYRETALVAAVSYQHLNCIKLLLKAGACVNVKNANGQSAIMVLFNGYPRLQFPPIVMVLLAAGEKMEPNILNQEKFETLRKLESEFELKHLCRKTVAGHMTEFSPDNLFIQMPKLQLPSSVTRYLLYNISLDVQVDEM